MHIAQFTSVLAQQCNNTVEYLKQFKYKNTKQQQSQLVRNNTHG